MKYRGSTSGAVMRERAVVRSQRRAVDVGGGVEEVEEEESKRASGDAGAVAVFVAVAVGGCWRGFIGAGCRVGWRR